MRARDRSSGGFGIVENAIGVALCSAMLGAVGAVTLRAQHSFESSAAHSALETRVRRAIDRIADEVAMASAKGLVPNPARPLWSASIDFSTPTGHAGQDVAWSDTTRIELQDSPADPRDGVDNDGDGFVDDGRVVVIRHLGLAIQQSTVLVDGVTRESPGEKASGEDGESTLADSRGLSFAMDGDSLTIRLTLGGRDDGGKLSTCTAATSVRLRN